MKIIVVKENVLEMWIIFWESWNGKGKYSRNENDSAKEDVSVMGMQRFFTNGNDPSEEKVFFFWNGKGMEKEMPFGMEWQWKS